MCSAGWNEYNLMPDVAIVLSRMYVNKKHRARYLVGKNILPEILKETERYNRLWITVNSYNKTITDWFTRSSEDKQPTLFADWPEIYKQFIPIGKHEVYYTIQDVIEYRKQND